MRWVLLSVVASVGWVCAAGAKGTPRSYTFGGFSPGGREYWKHGADDLVCGPAPSTTCRAVDRKDVKPFLRPARSRKAGALPLSVSVADDTRVTLVSGDRELGGFAPGGRVTKVSANLFVAPGDELVAVEYEVADGDGRRADVVVFDLSAVPAPAPSEPAPRPPAPDRGNAYYRAIGKGGVWEQRIVPCDQAGVTLKLSRTKQFDINITTRCQGQKDVTDLDGTWATEGGETLVLSFTNEDGPVENMVCRFGPCPDLDEECLTCVQDDVSFSMQVVRR